MKREQSKEDYLEAILQLSSDNKKVKSIDVANKLGFSKPSVSIAMKKLREDGFIVVNRDGSLSFTEKGLLIAQKTLEKHEFLTNFFIKIGVNPAVAEVDACEIEHGISEETFLKMKEFIKL